MTLAPVDNGMTRGKATIPVFWNDIPTPKPRRIWYPINFAVLVLTSIVNSNPAPGAANRGPMTKNGQYRPCF